MPDSFPGLPDSGSSSFPRGLDPQDAAPTQPDSPLLFRRYRVLKELGRGGMGVVMLAQDTAMDIPVAIKLVPDAVAKDTDAIVDLRKEVLRGMALNHDAVVRTNHFEKDETGAAIIMEFVDGHTLTELKAQQPGGCFDPDQMLPWLEVLCDVLDYAHRQKNFIHRDLKPRNLMLSRGGQLKVADFGIAALISDSMSQHSKDGIVSGTLSYMSPQQAQGKRPSPLDDIYSLGATIYELLTGKPPFFRGNAAAIYGQVLHEVPPSMDERRADLGVLEKKPIPEHWKEAIAACLAKEPEQRPQTAGEVLRRLQRHAGQTTAVKSPQRQRRIRGRLYEPTSQSVRQPMSPDDSAIPRPPFSAPPIPEDSTPEPPLTSEPSTQNEAGGLGDFLWPALVVLLLLAALVFLGMQ